MLPPCKQTCAVNKCVANLLPKLVLLNLGGRGKKNTNPKILTVQSALAQNKAFIYIPTEYPREGCIFFWVKVFGCQDNGKMGHLSNTQKRIV